MSDVTAPTCPKCGYRMELVPWSEWRLGERRTIDAICPNCLHVEQLVTMVATEEERCSTTQRRTLT